MASNGVLKYLQKFHFRYFFFQGLFFTSLWKNCFLPICSNISALRGKWCYHFEKVVIHISEKSNFQKNFLFLRSLFAYISKKSNISMKTTYLRLFSKSSFLFISPKLSILLFLEITFKHNLLAVSPKRSTLQEKRRFSDVISKGPYLHKY